MSATNARIEFLKGRQKGIGSSDVAPILGLSQWGTALSVYVEKVAPVTAAAMAMKPQLEWGIRKEPAVAGAIIDKYDWKLTKPPTLTHADHPFLLASCDRENQDGEPIEIKNTDNNFKGGWGEPETDDIPDVYHVQTQHQLEVRRSLGLFSDYSWVFVLIGHCDFRRYRVFRDPDYLGLVIDPLADFWRAVETRNPPDPDWGHKTTPAAIRAILESDPNSTVKLGDEVSLLADQYAEVGAEIRELEKERDEIKARILAALGTAGTGILPDGRQIVNKLEHRKGYTVEPTSFYKLYFKKGKR